jgi:signal transduction histidine kinase/CheY-like chemotaxis protein
VEHNRASEGRRILICAPSGRDCSSVAARLIASGYETQTCADLGALAAAVDHRTGAILITEEALNGNVEALADTVAEQPPWSDVPFILLLERPLGTPALLNAVDAALGNRRRQVDRAQAEAARRQSKTMEAVGQLTGGIAHDFNNMLCGIIGSLEILKRRIAAGRLDDVQRFIDAASASATCAASLTQRLLAFSRRQSLDAKIVDLNRLVGSLNVSLRRTLNEQSALTIELAPGMPSGIFDAHQLESALLNLAINAREAMPDGGRIAVRTGSIELDDETAAASLGLATGRYVTVSVSDTGVGMSPDQLDRAFEPFFTTKPLGQGTGLGLSMVYGFARQSGGQVRIQSKPGAGTSVTLYLPATDSEPTEDLQTPAVQIDGGDRGSVLFVEDDASVRLLIRDVLQDLGYSPIEAAEPESALPILASDRRIDLMISDVSLPGMNGRQLAEVARKHRPLLPILFITGYAENAAIRAGFLGSNMAMIMKPFAIDSLAAKIGEMTRAPMN